MFVFNITFFSVSFINSGDISFSDKFSAKVVRLVLFLALISQGSVGDFHPSVKLILVSRSLREWITMPLLDKWPRKPDVKARNC